MSVRSLAIKPGVIVLAVALVALVCGRVGATSIAVQTSPVATAPAVGAALVARNPALPFTVAQGSGALFVLLQHPQSLGIALRTPAGQLLTTNNIWRVGRWYADGAVDVISVDAPTAGDWQVVGAPASAATLFVAQDLALVAVDAPQYLANDRSTVLRWRLQARGQTVDSAPLAGWLVARAHLRSEAGGAQDVPVRHAAGGALEVDVPPLPAAVYTLDLEAWVKTLGLRAQHSFTSAPAPAIRYQQRGSDTVLWVTSNTAGLASASLALVATVQGPDQRTRYLSGTRLNNGSYRLFIAGSDWRGVPGDLRVSLELQGRTLGGKPWRAPTRVVTFTNGAPSLASVPASVGKRLGASLKPTQARGSLVRDHIVDGEHRRADQAIRAADKGDAGRSSPGRVSLAALALANLTLIALVLWRARRIRRAATMVATAVTAAALQSESRAEDSATDAGDDLSPSAPPADAEQASATAPSAPDAPSLETLLSPAVEAEEIIVDDDMLAELASLAATQSDLRSHTAAGAA